MPDLTDVEQAMLAFEHRRWNRLGAREQAIHDEFGMSLHRYEQALRALIQRPEAQAHDPVVVNRLLRLQETRRRSRAG